jgi:hypothetical protein
MRAVISGMQGRLSFLDRRLTAWIFAAARTLAATSRPRALG